MHVVYLVVDATSVAVDVGFEPRTNRGTLGLVALAVGTLGLQRGLGGVTDVVIIVIAGPLKISDSNKIIKMTTVINAP